jgi:hypothetical protein
VIKFRVYVINSDTGEKSEVKVEEYDDGKGNVVYSDIYSLSQAMPPCSCPRCRPAAAELRAG